MTVATITAQSPGLTGAGITTQAATATDYWQNSGSDLLRITNGSGASVTATVHAAKTCNEGFFHDDAVVVGAGQTVEIGPFSPSRFNDQYGNTEVTYSATASVTVAVIRV